MTNKQNDIENRKRGSFKMIVHVHVSSGREIEHVIDIPSNVPEALKELEVYSNMISEALSGESSELNYLFLTNPQISYSLPHIVFIEVSFKGPKEWEELMRISIKRPAGFKSPVTSGS